MIPRSFLFGSTEPVPSEATRAFARIIARVQRRLKRRQLRAFSRIMAMVRK